MAPKLVITVAATRAQWLSVTSGRGAAFGVDEAPLNSAIAGTKTARAISADRLNATAKVMVLFMMFPPLAPRSNALLLAAKIASIIRALSGIRIATRPATHAHA